MASASSFDRYLGQTVRLSRNGCDSIEIDVENLSVSILSRAFSVSQPLILSCCTLFIIFSVQVDSSAVWLKEEAPGIRAFFPDAHNKKFLNAEGSPLNECRSIGGSFSGIGIDGYTPSTSEGSLGFASSSRVPSNTNRHCPKPIYQSKRSSQTCVNVKVVQAKLSFENNKLEFEVNNQTVIEVTEETVNVNYILGAVQSDCFTVVMNDDYR